MNQFNKNLELVIQGNKKILNIRPTRKPVLNYFKKRSNSKSKKRSNSKSNSKSNSNERFLIITTGSTGSGKTALVEQIMKIINKTSRTFEKTMIDNLIENDPYYKTRVRTIIKEIEDTAIRNSVNPETFLKNYISNPDADLYNKFTAAYYETRKTHGCNNIETKINCDTLNDNHLFSSFDNNKNVIFEFTGGYIPTWLMDRVPDNYTVIFAYSLVSIRQIIERNKSRAYSSIIKFKDDTTNTVPAPRLPNVEFTQIEPTMNTMNTILNKIREDCLDNINTICGKHKIDRLIIFDNNTTMELLFDSNVDKNMSKPEFTNIVNKYSKLMFTPSMSPTPVNTKLKSPILIPFIDEIK